MLHFHRLLSLILLGCTFMAPALQAHAQTSYSTGQRLSEVQISALNAQPSIDIKGQNYRVLSTGTSSQGLPFSLVLGPNGVVGQSFHELLIAEIPVQTVRAQFSDVIAQAANVQYQEAADMTILRFTTLAQAAAALRQIQKLKSGVEAGIPITFELPRTR